MGYATMVLVDCMVHDLHMFGMTSDYEFGLILYSNTRAPHFVNVNYKSYICQMSFTLCD